MLFFVRHKTLTLLHKVRTTPLPNKANCHEVHNHVQRATVRGRARHMAHNRTKKTRVSPQVVFIACPPTLALTLHA